LESGLEEKEMNMAKLNTPDLLGQFKDMTLVELTEYKTKNKIEQIN